MPQHRRACKEARCQHGPDLFGLGDGKGRYVLLNVTGEIDSLLVLANVGVTAPIIGTTSLEKLKDNIGQYLYSIDISSASLTLLEPILNQVLSM